MKNLVLTLVFALCCVSASYAQTNYTFCTTKMDCAAKHGSYSGKKTNRLISFSLDENGNGKLYIRKENGGKNTIHIAGVTETVQEGKYQSLTFYDKKGLLIGRYVWVHHDGNPTESLTWFKKNRIYKYIYECN